MFKINLKIAWRNLMHNRLYSLTNIGGLAVGLTASIIMLLYHTHLGNYDAWDPGFKDVYRLRFIDKTIGNSNSTLSPKMLPVLNAEVPEIQTSTRVYRGNGGTLLRIGEKKFYEDDIVNVDSTFFKVFPFKLKYGDRRTALQDLNSVIISEALAQKYFGTKDPMGQTIRYDEKNDYIITGVLETPPGPTAIKVDVLMRIVVPKWAQENGWGNFMYTNYVKLTPGVDLKKVNDKMTYSFLNAAYDHMKDWMEWPPSFKTFMQQKNHHMLEAMPIADVALEETKQELFVLTLLSVIILAVACINFTNQTIANADSRAKEIGVRKVMGGLRRSLTTQFMMETFLQCIFALLLSFILVELLLPSFNKLSQEKISLLAYCTKPGFIYKTLFTLFGVAILSGIYPAFYLSAFQPVKVLKGNFDRGTGGMLFRKVLLGFQFTFSIGFIISLIILSKQTSYMTNFSVGFKPENVTYVMLQEKTSYHNFAYIKDKLLQIPHISSVSRTNNIPWADNGTNNYNIFAYKEHKENIQEVRIDNDFFKAMGVEMKEGREYLDDHPADSSDCIIVNEAMVKQYGIPEPAIGELISISEDDAKSPKNYKIIGVTKNFMMHGFKEQIKPAVFWKNYVTSSSYLCVINIDPKYYNETIKKVSDLWKDIEPQHPIVYANTNDDFKKITTQYNNLQKIVSLFAVVTIIIAFIGLLALIAYNLKRRLKEIGIRKVVGASLNDILLMMNKEFIYMLLISNFTAWAVAYLLMRNFLNQFSYRIDIPFLVFPLITLCSLAVTSLVVCLRVWNAIRVTPSEVLKYE
ncbi:ABC transporter permease [Chitinophagaceae bacterium LWZ2-11]